MLNVVTDAPQITQFTQMDFEKVLEIVKPRMIGRQADPNQEYDERVQAVLDKWWPETTELHNIKRIPGKAVYTAQFGGNEVIVKSITYTKEMLVEDHHQMDFLNFIGEQVSVANFIEPGVEQSEDGGLIVTMSRFAPGVAPEQVPPQEPNTWIFNENCVKAEAKWWSDFRQRSIDFKSAYPDDYA